MSHLLTLLFLLGFVVPALAVEAPVPASGARDPDGAGGYTLDVREDGATQRGVAWPVPRFADNGNGTVTDHLTGLVWLKQANFIATSGTTGTATWTNARTFCNALKHGQCGLSDGSKAGQWRLPSIRELKSLLHANYNYPALANTAGTAKWAANDPFLYVQSSGYWSSTTYAANTGYAWLVFFHAGHVDTSDKTITLYVWPVRAGP